MKDDPYIRREELVITLVYNPEYGDDRVCVCGHKYYRHFDTYAEMNACGCKYCECETFIEDNGTLVQR